MKSEIKINIWQVGISITNNFIIATLFIVIQ